jgi:hypothetical protein
MQNFCVPTRPTRCRAPLMTAAVLVALIAALAPVTSGAQASRVIVANSRTGPALVQDVDNPARAPFQVQLGNPIAAGANAPNGSFSVPAGRRLVIEHVSALVVVPAGQRVMYTNINTFSGGGLVFHHLKAQSAGVSTATPGEGYITSESLRLYADPGTSVLVAVNRSDSAGTGFMSVSVSGYLVKP